MTASVPLVSVNLVTYNHEPFIAEAMRSVLNQSFTDLELVVVNDGSTDRTRQQIEANGDARVVAIHQENCGPAAATNRGLAACRGRFVASMSGDDVCHPERIARQLDEYVRGDSRVLFSGVDFIDDEGRALNGRHFAAGSFEQGNLDRAQVFERLFRHGNYFNSITTFTEKAILQDSGGYDPALLQLQDYELWVRLIKQYDLWIMPEKLVYYRIRAGNENLSSPEPVKQIASMNEHYLVMRRFFDGVSPELFRQAFVDQLKYPECSTAAELAFEQAHLHLQSPHAFNKLIGLERLSALLADPDSAAEIFERYRFGPPQIFALLRGVNVLNLFAGHESVLFLDTGAGWNAGEQVISAVNLYAREFCVSFRLLSSPVVKALRWDPMEGRVCRVQIEQVEFHDDRGKRGVVDRAGLTSNGTALPDGTVAFDTTDPMFFLPVEGPVSRICIRGRWEVEEPSQSLQRWEQEVNRLRRALAETERTQPRRAKPHGWRRLLASFRSLLT